MLLEKVYLLTLNSSYGEEVSLEVYASQESAQKEADRINKIEKDWAENPNNPRPRHSGYASVEEKDVIA